MAEPLTDARRAVWKAIREWPDTRAAFKRQFDFEQESACIPQIGPAFSDLPCISIFPTTVDPRWWVYSMQEWTYALRIQIWTKDWMLPENESLLRKVTDAIFQSKVTGEIAGYVETELGRLPVLSPTSFQYTTVEADGEDEPMKATLSEIVILLKIERDPLGRP